MAIAAGDSQQHQLAIALPCDDDDDDDDKLIKFKLISTLEEIWNHIEAKKDELEIICQESRKLLKPLPKQLHQQNKSEKKISLDEQKVHECKTSELENPENEIAELKLIDKALEKAEKAWKKHRYNTKDSHSCEKSAKELVKEQKSKTELGSNPKNVSITKVVSDDSKIGVISEKKLTKALSNVQISRMKAAYKKAPYKTFDCEQKKIPHSSSRTNKSQPKSFSSQESSHSKNSALKNSNHSKDGKFHSTVKSLQANPNLSKDSRTHSMVKSLNINKSSGSLQEKKKNDFKVTESEENQKKMEFKLDMDETKNSEPLYVIPPSIKELYQKNNSLKRKIMKMKEHPKSAESFLHLWETKMKKTPNDEAKVLCQKYENLFILLQSLNLPCISDSSSPQEILEAKISVEYILTSMYDLNNQTEILLKKAKSTSVAAITSQMEPVPQTVPKEIWLPPHLLNSPFYHQLKESSLQLHYSSLEELNEYWDKQHKLQESLLSQHILKIVFECLLPLLKSQHTEQREKIFLYRILWGFLHHNGRQFPTLIES